MPATETRRKYIRISTVLPVEFYVVDKAQKQLTPWLQGFTHDIGKGGISLYINDLWWGFGDTFKHNGSSLFVKIDFPLRNTSFATKARVAWVRQNHLKEFNQYNVGLEFQGAAKATVDGLFRYALARKYIPRIVAGVLIGLLIYSGTLFLQKQSLVKENRTLVRQYVTLTDRSTELEDILDKEKKTRDFFKTRKETLQKQIDELNNQVARLKALSQPSQEQTDQPVVAPKKEIAQLQEQLARLKRENEFLKKQEQQQAQQTANIQQEIKAITQQRSQFSQRIIQGTCDWIKNRQDLDTGLVLSYEGDRDLEKVCFSYDQALAVNALLLMNEPKRAAKVLGFFYQKLKRGDPLYNGYFTNGSVFEYETHSGPYAWVGIAALNYEKITGNKKYRLIAQRTARFLLKMMDREGGIKGGPKVQWYSTEHNLDAFAFFTMLAEQTRDKKYAQAAEKIKDWIFRYAYTGPKGMIKRGKGDATIATDTYAWSIIAFTPQKLISSNMSPDAIMDFAIEHCEVQTTFKRREGQVRVRGFDFAKMRNRARGGVVSCEWTAQMILSFEAMANYYKTVDPQKYTEYLEQSMLYFNELQKMMITSPSKIGREDPCLPYASVSAANTGHGWRTPKGNRTGSLASTAYFLIAYFGYNPLRAQYLQVSLKDVYSRQVDRLAATDQ